MTESGSVLVPDQQPAVLEDGLVDCHAHLCSPVFDEDREEVLERARAAGVEAIVAVGETIEDARRNLELAETWGPMVRPAAGLYPTYVDLELASQMEDFLREHRERLVAIGEVGLDRWKVRDEEELEIQRQIFARSIELSLELDLPLNVHSRSAGHYAVDLLLEKGAERAQLHAFDGKASKAMPAVEAGMFFSVPPSVVRSKQKQKLVRRLPLECLLLETDSPVLGADRDVRNEPAEVQTSLAAIAELKAVPVAEVAEHVRENTRRLYRFDRA